VEYGDKLYAVDQHAAHERILFEQFIHGPIPKQELLVALPFHTDSAADDAFLQDKRADFARMALDIEGGNGDWRITALPAGWHLGDQETVAAILGMRNAGEDFTRRWAATCACHSAIKDGGWLDDDAALRLAEAAIGLPGAALSLPTPACPHGRPIYTIIEKDTLLRAVKRL
jgi:DNA mismatch repair protein MutL